MAKRASTRPVGTRRPSPEHAMGLAALLLSVIAVLLGTLFAFTAGYIFGGAAQYADLTELTGALDPEALPPAGRDIVAAAGTQTLIAIVAFGVPGLWGFIQGIVATVKRRGRRFGIAAIVTSSLGLVLVQLCYFAGLAAGAAPYV